MSRPNFTMNELAEIVCDETSSNEAKRVALSRAYQLGMYDAKAAALLRDVRESYDPKKIPQ